MYPTPGQHICAPLLWFIYTWLIAQFLVSYLYNGLHKLATMTTIPRGDVGDTNGLGSLKDHTRDARIAAEVKVGLGVHDAVHVG